MGWAAAAPAIAQGVASAATLAADLFGGGGGGNQKDNIANLLQNPMAGVVANLFGMKAVPSGRGGFRLLGGDYAGPSQNFAPQVFTPNKLRALGDLADPTPLDPMQELAMQVSGESYPSLMEAYRMFDESILPTAEQMATTGLPTDLQPIIDARRRAFERETLPTALERVSGDFGLQGTAATNILGQLGLDLETDLGGLQVGADEAAKQRMLTGLPLAGQLATARAAMPTSAAADLFGLGSQFRAANESMRPEVALLNAIMALTNPGYFQGSTSGVSVGGTEEGGGGLSALAEGFGGSFGQGMGAGMSSSLMDMMNSSSSGGGGGGGGGGGSSMP